MAATCGIPDASASTDKEPCMAEALHKQGNDPERLRPAVDLPADTPVTASVAYLAEHPKVLFLIVFASLLAVNWATLTNPPYWDAIMGVFNQGVWLDKNDFDFVRLWTTEPKFRGGGSNLDSPSILPVLLAVLYKLFDPTAVFLLYHLATVFMSALVFVLFFLILAKHISPTMALLWCLAAASEPVWGGRCAEIYRDVPVMTCGSLAIYYLHRQRLRLVALWIGVGLLVKQTALLLVLAFLVWMPAKALVERRWSRPQIAGPGRRTRVVAVVVGIAVSAAGLAHIWQWAPPIRIGVALRLMPLYFLYFFPALAVELALIALVFTRLCVAVARRTAGDSDSRQHTTAFSLYLFILVGAFWGGYALLPEPCPRYAAFVVFPMVSLLALHLPKRLSLLLAVSVIAWGSLNQYGGLLPPLVPHRARSGESLERSREFLVDLEANRVICRTLEQEFFDTPIVAKWPFVQMLTMPEMGYVRNALPKVYSTGVRPRYTPAKLYNPETPMPPETLYIYAPNAFENWDLFGPRLKPKTGDTLVFADESLPGRILVYRRRVTLKGTAQTPLPASTSPDDGTTKTLPARPARQVDGEGDVTGPGNGRLR